VIHLLALLVGAVLIFAILFVMYLLTKINVPVETITTWFGITVAISLLAYLFGGVILLAFGIDIGLY
jgi:hypothetical protein